MISKLPHEEELRRRVQYGHDNYKPYPSEVVEDVIWLRGYVRRRCDDNNLFLLAEHARLKGFNNVPNYFYQIFTGRYFQPDPKKEDTIIGSVKNFRDLCAQLAIYDRFANTLAKTRFVETTVWRMIDDYISRKETPFNTCRFGMIIGATGNQKSESFKEKVRRAKPGMVNHMECTAEPSLSQFIHKLGWTYGASLHDSIGEKRIIIRESLNEGRTLILDNIQRGYDPKRGSVQPIFDDLQELQDDTQFTPILSLTPVADKFIAALQNDYFEQFLGRVGGERDILRIDPFPCDEDIELIAKSFRLSDKDVAELLPRLRELVREKGRIRALFGALQESARLSNLAKQDFSAKHIRQYLGD